MTKKHFIALAEQIKDAAGTSAEFTPDQIQRLANFCQRQNYNFNSNRWLGFIKGTCGPNGGSVNKPKL